MKVTFHQSIYTDITSEQSFRKKYHGSNSHTTKNVLKIMQTYFRENSFFYTVTYKFNDYFNCIFYSIILCLYRKKWFKKNAMNTILKHLDMKPRKVINQAYFSNLEFSTLHKKFGTVSTYKEYSKMKII